MHLALIFLFLFIYLFFTKTKSQKPPKKQWTHIDMFKASGISSLVLCLPHYQLRSHMLSKALTALLYYA